MFHAAVIHAPVPQKFAKQALRGFFMSFIVAIQDERSQHKNKAKALKVLRARIFEQERLAKQKNLSEERRDIIGTGDRSERIRTYNFPQAITFNA